MNSLHLADNTALTKSLALGRTRWGEGDNSVQISGDLISHCHECDIYCHVVMWDCHECHTLSHSSQICINYQFDWLGHGMKPGKQIKLQNPIVLYFLIKFLNLNCTGCVATLIIPQKM